MTIGFLGEGAELKFIATQQLGYGGFKPSNLGAQDGDFMVVGANGEFRSMGSLGPDNSFTNMFNQIFYKFLGAGDADKTYDCYYDLDGNRTTDALAAVGYWRGATSATIKATLETSSPGTVALSAGFSPAADHLGLIGLVIDYANGGTPTIINGAGSAFLQRVSAQGHSIIYERATPPETLYGGGALTISKSGAFPTKVWLLEMRGA